jgi:tetratricopeptide (TPR) repeat protein
LAELLGQSPTAAAQSVDSATVARQVLFTPWDDYDSWQNVWNLLSLGVFAGQPEREERDAFITAKTISLREELDRNWEVGRLDMLYREARAAAPDDPVLDFIAGRLFLGVNANQLAENALRAGLARCPVYPEACLNLARLLLIRADYQGVEQMLVQAERYAPQHPRLPLLRGTLFARTGRLSEARTLLEQVVANQPSQHNAWVNLGNVCLLQGDESAAQRVYQRCLELEPNDPYVMASYARLLATASASSPEQRQLSLHYARQAVRLKPADYRYRGSLAVAFAASGQAVEAAEEARRALSGAATAGDEGTRSTILTDLARFDIRLEP